MPPSIEWPSGVRGSSSSGGGGGSSRSSSSGNSTSCSSISSTAAAVVVVVVVVVVVAVMLCPCNCLWSEDTTKPEKKIHQFFNTRTPCILIISYEVSHTTTTTTTTFTTTTAAAATTTTTTICPQSLTRYHLHHDHLLLPPLLHR